MKRTYGYGTIAILLIGCVATLSHAEPSAGILSLLATPASAFDEFLHRLYIQANGATYFGGPMMKEQLRLFALDYDPGSNLITMKFHIGPAHHLLKDFGAKELGEKKVMLLAAAKDLSVSLGLEPHGNTGIRYGLIQDITIRYGWRTKEFNEAQVKNEIADRTVFVLVYASEEKLIYQAKRTQDGLYEFSVDPKSP